MNDKTIICPNCRQSPAQPKPLFPFCSERCKTADLGAWAAEKYRVPLFDPEESLRAAEELASGDSSATGEKPSETSEQ